MKMLFLSFCKIVARLWRKAMDFLLPPLCLGCDGLVSENQTLCAACWKEIHFIAPPLCARCGAPFDLPVEEGTLCGACLETPPLYTAARSAVLYDDASKHLILRLKHADRLHPVPALAAWMRSAGASFWAQGEVIAPVPLHRWRLLRRRYNQSALLALALGRAGGKKVIVDLLERVRPTDSQGHRNRKERHENVADAFRVRGDVSGRKIILVDDVLTSGATVNECARTLLKAGACAVYVLTFARARLAS